MKKQPKKLTLAAALTELRAIERKAAKELKRVTKDDDDEDTDNWFEEWGQRHERALKSAMRLLRLSVTLPTLSNQEEWPGVARIVYAGLRNLYGPLYFPKRREGRDPYETQWLTLFADTFFSEQIKWQLDSVQARLLLDELFGIDCDLHSRLWRYLRNRIPVLNAAAR